MSGNSTSAGSVASLQRTSWRTFTNTSLPVRPSLIETSSMVEVRATRSPTRIGERNSNWLPAHMRRGSGTGGRNPPRLAWPSGPISLCWCSGRKYSQCHSGGNGVPFSTGVAGWSSVASSAFTGVGPSWSRSLSLRPIQACRSFREVFMAVVLPASLGRQLGLLDNGFPLDQLRLDQRTELLGRAGLDVGAVLFHALDDLLVGQHLVQRL